MSNKKECVYCKKDLSFISGNEYFCLDCFDRLMSVENIELIRLLGKSMSNTKDINNKMKKLIEKYND